MARGPWTSNSAIDARNMRGLAAKRETRGYVGMIYRQIYDVSPDDQRFVMLRRIIDNDDQQLIVVENFFEELKAKVGN